ncbi:hypothetical protein NQU59_09355 [Acinetobacter colistiniresistens]|uniref:hypothetical protein n=1 Tax=Acinetobacter colistiniresistens TaxID=280145 RepID=UPI00211C6346|nr:hypothetical protein [Acinetobacter colistiniresistens]UUM25961.1 hypothetical protein NQU59_09355 [Acinetobacter colistiniresistens]
MRIRNRIKCFTYNNNIGQLENNPIDGYVIKGMVKIEGANVGRGWKVVLLCNSSLNKLAATLTDANGEYTFKGLKREYKFTVIASPPPEQKVNTSVFGNITIE